MRRIHFSIFFTISFFTGLGIAWSQSTDTNPYSNESTYIPKKSSKRNHVKKEKPLRYIIKNDTKKTLSGNVCFEEQTRNMGFMYIAIPKGQPPNKNGWKRFWHNMGAKTSIFFKNGPFWKSKVNKRYKKCMFSSGDYIG